MVRRDGNRGVECEAPRRTLSSVRGENEIRAGAAGLRKPSWDRQADLALAFSCKSTGPR